MSKKYYCESRVIFGDTDAMGIVYYGNYARWFEIGRAEYLRQIGYPYFKLEKEGIWLPVTELVCKYKMPAFYDDILEIASWADELGGASVVMGYEIRRKSTGELLAQGKTYHAVTGSDLKPIMFKKLWPEFHADVVKTMEAD
jgi:acyl-CoA thioester hydrolase